MISSIPEISSRKVKQQAHNLGFHKVGIALANNFVNQQISERLKALLNQGYQAKMP